MVSELAARGPFPLETVAARVPVADPGGDRPHPERPHQSGTGEPARGGTRQGGRREREGLLPVHEDEVRLLRAAGAAVPPVQPGGVLQVPLQDAHPDGALLARARGGHQPVAARLARGRAGPQVARRGHLLAHAHEPPAADGLAAQPQARPQLGGQRAVQPQAGARRHGGGRDHGPGDGGSLASHRLAAQLGPGLRGRVHGRVHGRQHRGARLPPHPQPRLHH